MVVGGQKAIKGQHYDETYSPVLSLVILRMVLALFAAWSHVITTVSNAEQAYLNGKMQETVHVKAPKGLTVPPGYVRVLEAAARRHPRPRLHPERARPLLLLPAHRRRVYHRDDLRRRHHHHHRL
jgi:hypothetical protein